MLGNRAILGAMNEGLIEISPFNIHQLGPNSYDIRINRYYIRQRDTVNPQTLDLSESKRIDPSIIWGSPINAMDGTGPGRHGTIDLAPGELILASTIERIGTNGDIVAEMKSRSSMMRIGTAICIDAGLGDVGFNSRWTMEVYNHTRHHIRIPVGMRVGQMCFYRVEGAELTYQEKGGTYGSKDAWTPADMLPRSTIM